MQKPLSQVWDLDVFFPGGSKSEALEAHLGALEAEVPALRRRIEALPGADADAWSQLLDVVQDMGRRLTQAAAFVGCLTAQNVKDEPAKLLEGRIHQLSAALGAVQTILDRRMLEIPDGDWQALLTDPRIEPVAFPLSERRRRAAEKLPPEQELLAIQLAVDGYHGWSQLYDTIVGRMTLPFEQDGKVTQLSMGQAANKLLDADRKVRADVFAKWEQAWAAEAELCAAALNHLAGFRLNLYRQRGWDSVLKEPLDINRMSQATLEAMWGAVEANKDRLVKYLERKARLLGVERLSWHDVTAPLAASDKKLAYDDAAELIVEQFGRFSPRMADFAREAFDQRWIEAEDRPGKQPGGFCTSFPVSEQSRIFMTYSGNMSNAATLAHELGHAWHGRAMRGLPTLARRYAMNVAETASTFAEMLVADATLKQATTREEKLALLDDKVERSVAFFMNIHARFLFETRFYEARKKRPLGVAELNELMLAAQKEAYRGALGEYHPHFWASKLHFYITGVPFYNFPYTFGYLFSYGVYARALAEGPAFEERYVDLLRDTGRMTVEDLAARHLGVDLTKPDFWQSAVGLAVADVEEFLRLTS